MFNRLTFQLTYPFHGFRFGSARICRCPDVEGALALAQAFSHRILRPLKLLSWGDGAMMRSWSFSSFLIDVGKIGIYYDNSWDSMGCT